MGFEINWTTTDPAVLNHPLYLAYSATPFGSVSAIAVKQDLAKALASKESAGVVAYLCWLLRVVGLLTG